MAPFSDHCLIYWLVSMAAVTLCAAQGHRSIRTTDVHRNTLVNARAMRVEVHSAYSISSSSYIYNKPVQIIQALSFNIHGLMGTSRIVLT